MARREELVAEIACEEQRLTELRSEVDDRTVHLRALREELASLPPAIPSTLAPAAVATTTPSNLSRTSQDASAGSPSRGVSASSTMSNAGKVALFRPLFRGREDVFPRRWENQKTGKSGYSPACSNEWEHGLCEKKKGKREGRRATCAECPNQAFVPVSDAEIAKHLRGDQIMGVYPLLANETCWVLAADFDKKAWEDDVAAFVETSRAHGLPVAVERSRSGNGAHAWFFFASPVAASVARKMGCFLITEAMARRHQLSMESYDRLFPNQDTMPKGGFGNLIALPLQRTARDQASKRSRRRVWLRHQ